MAKFCLKNACVKPSWSLLFHVYIIRWLKNPQVTIFIIITSSLKLNEPHVNLPVLLFVVVTNCWLKTANYYDYNYSTLGAIQIIRDTLRGLGGGKGTGKCHRMAQGG